METAILPSGWEKRLRPIQSPLSAAVGLVLDPADLAVATLAAGREKDGPFVTALFVHRFADPDVVRARIQEVPVARLTVYGLTASVLEKRLERILAAPIPREIHPDTPACDTQEGDPSPHKDPSG